ncbi:MAG TPA: hypothetical protein VM943_09980 [Pyrinomonadaceae bacterium]|nr:hypothetical protein [Pyrinomonadaceae bacterium]
MRFGITDFSGGGAEETRRLFLFEYFVTRTSGVSGVQSTGDIRSNLAGK